MAGLIGIVFFVVLLMSLDITESAAQHQTDETATLVERLREELASKIEYRDALSAQVRSQLDRLNAATNFTAGRLKEDIEGLTNRLATTELDIEAAAEDLEAMRNELARTQRQNQALAAKKSATEEEVDSLRLELETKRPNVTYIVGSGVSKQPWLVEVTAGAIRVGTTEGHVVAEFRGGSPSLRTDDLLSWASRLSPRSHYLVLVVKPSGHIISGALGPRLERAGFDIGLDYMPEEWRPFAED